MDYIETSKISEYLLCLFVFKELFCQCILIAHIMATQSQQQATSASKTLSDIGLGVAKLNQDSAETKVIISEILAKLSQLERAVSALSLQSADKKGGRSDKKGTDKTLEETVAGLLSAKKVTRGYATWALLCAILPSLNKYPSYSLTWIYKYVVMLLVEMRVRATMPAIAPKSEHGKLYNQVSEELRESLKSLTPEQAVNTVFNTIHTAFGINPAKPADEQKNEVFKLLDEIKAFLKAHDIKQFHESFKTNIDRLYEFIKAENAKTLLQNGGTEVKTSPTVVDTLSTPVSTTSTISPFGLPAPALTPIPFGLASATATASPSPIALKV